MPKTQRKSKKFIDDQLRNERQNQQSWRINSYRAARDFDGYDVSRSTRFEDQVVRPGLQTRDVNPSFPSPGYLSREQVTRWQQRQHQHQHQQARTETPPLVLSTSTLLPVQVDPRQPYTHTYNSEYTASPDIPPLEMCSNIHAKQIGVFGWGPPSGPAGCKLLVFIHHTSLLAVKLLSLLHTRQDFETRFWIDFDGTKVPAAPHKYYFHENEYALEDVNAEGLGRDREVLLALVPASVRRRVPIWLYVVGDRGRQEHNVQLGYFEYDDGVPLKTYGEVARSGQNLVKFLDSERPNAEDVRDLSQYLNSEILVPFPREGDLNNDEIEASQQHSQYSQSQLVLNQRPRRTTKTKQSPDMLSQTSHTLSPLDPDSSYASTLSSPPSSTSPLLSRRQSNPPSTRRNKPSSTTSTIPPPRRRPVRHQYVTITFTDPKPSTLGLPTYDSWTSQEKAQHRRLVAFTCRSDTRNFKGHFTAITIPHLGLAPHASKVVSCIYVPVQASQKPHTCIITSYDFINLISWMLRKPPWFTVHERNRVRRNLEIFNPQTLHKAGAFDVWDLFKQVTGYQNPKPWNIQKDFKVFDWKFVEDMMREILKKYTVVVGDDYQMVEGPGEEEDGAEGGGETDDIEDELVKANRDLLEEFARMQERSGEKRRRRNDPTPSFTSDWESGQRLPGHPCVAEETGVEGQQDLIEDGQWHTFGAGEEIGLGNIQTQCFDTSQGWDFSQSQTSHFNSFHMDPNEHFANGFESTMGFSESFEGMNHALQNYYDQSQIMSQGWPMNLDVPQLDIHDNLHPENLSQPRFDMNERPLSNEPKQGTSDLKHSDEEKLSIEDMIGSPSEESTVE